MTLLEKSGKEFEVIKYLEDIPIKEELREIINCLGLSPEHLFRKNEIVWKEQYKNKLLSSEEVLDVMIKYPKLIERHIVFSNGRAVLGRPIENIEALLN